MDLPEGPPGAEGYEDSVVEVPTKKPDLEECTKAEHEFQEHLNSLKIKVEDESLRPMVERRGRDVSGKWVYLCYPCHAMCSGENILQTHISGKKHKHRIASRTTWPLTIFSEHPYVLNEKGHGKDKPTPEVTERTLQKMAEEVRLYNSKASEYDQEFCMFREQNAYINSSLDALKAPLVGVEYLIEHPGEEAHHEPSYTCSLCIKQGHPRTIINHLTCFWHRYNYICRHYQKACALLSPYRVQNQYREGAALIINRLIQRIDEKFGRQRPLVIDKSYYENRKDQIHTWISKSYHFSENNGPSFVEVVDVDLIISLHTSEVKCREFSKKTSPHAAGDKPKSGFNSFSRPVGRQERRASSIGSLSDVSNEEGSGRPSGKRSPPLQRSSRYEPYRRERNDDNAPYRTRYAIKNTISGAASSAAAEKDKTKAPNYEHKVKLATEKREASTEAARKMLAYHEKNPEKHPLYPEEWKKFWNKRYKEIVAEGKDPSTHDFKPEWIVYWTKRMKELHDIELKLIVDEIYRKFNLTPPPVMGDMPKVERVPERSPDRRPLVRGPERRRSPDSYRRGPAPRKRSPEPRRYSPAAMHRREIDARRRSPVPRRRSPSPRRISPSVRRRSPSPRRRSPSPRRPSPSQRRRSPSPRRPSPMARRRSPSPRRRPSPRHRSSPSRYLRTRSRSPVRSSRPEPSHTRARSPPRTNFVLESLRRSESPLSRREQAMRNKSPTRVAPLPNAQLISDDELKPDNGGASPWNSDNDISSLPSLPDARSSPPFSIRRSRSPLISEHSRSTYAHSHSREHSRGYSRMTERDGPEDVVSVLRLLVALEDHLGSLGPKIVDLLTEALKMEKEKANSSEELLDRENSVFLMETAKEKLKGALQAGLVTNSASAPVRAAIVKVAGLVHLADQRAKAKVKDTIITPRLGVASVGDVQRVQIAEQMAAALIAQGKTDVTAEELAQLVDAVVGMAEAKKREAAAKAAKPIRSIANTASALQLLQSAYNENDNKKLEKEDPPDAMDGLSDSDLETLLKNFNELSAEEQHSLVAYLKKMESKEPKRVERLREYVSAAVTSSAAATPTVKSVPQPPPPAVEPKKAELVKDVQVIDSDDDDDYTVEEVFKSAKQKVKEDQIRHEMEIVKKSLEETKAAAAVVAEASPPKQLNIDSVDINMSSATNLLAMVQASIAKASSATQPVNSAPDDSQSTEHHSYEESEQKSSTPPSMDLQDDLSNQMPFNQDTNDQMSFNQNMPTNNTVSQMQIRPIQDLMQDNMPQHNSAYQEMGENSNELNRMMPNNYNDTQSGNQWDQSMDIDNSDMAENHDNYDNNYNDYNEQVDNSNGMQDMYGVNQNYGGHENQNYGDNDNQNYGGNTNQNPMFGGNNNQNPNFGGNGNQNPSFGGNLNQNPNFGDYSNQNQNFGGNNMKPQNFGDYHSSGNFNNNRNNHNFRARGGSGRGGGGRGGTGSRGGGDIARGGRGGGDGARGGKSGSDGARGARGGGRGGRGGGDGGRGGRGGGKGGSGGRGGGDGGRGGQAGRGGRGGRGGGGGFSNRGGARGNFSGGRGNRGGRW